MRQSRRQKKNKPIELTDLYAMKLGAIRGALKQEHISLTMLCVYFFFEYVRPQNIYPELNILPWGMLTLSLALISAIADPSSRLVSNVQNRLLVLFSIIVLLSGIFAFRPSVSLEYAALFGTWFLAYFVGTSVLNTERRLLLFLLAYFLFNIKMSLSGTISWGMRGFSFTKFGLVGSPGYFKDSGEFALQMLVYGSLSLSVVVSLKDYWGRYKKIFYYGLAATGYMVVLGASSRGSQIGLLVIGAWFLLRQKGGFKGLILIIIASVILYQFIPEQQMERLREMGDDSSSLQRLEYWAFGLKEVIPNHPVLGVGYQNWLVYFSYLYPNGVGPLETTQGVHNIYIQAASELGLTGFFVYLLLIIYAFINNARTRAMAAKIENTLLFNISYGLDAGLIGFLVAGTFVTVLYYPYFWIQILMIVALNNVTKLQYDEKFKVRSRSVKKFDV